MLREHQGNWVVLEGETIIASDGDAGAAIAAARRAGIPTPYVFYVELDDGTARLAL